MRKNILTAALMALSVAFAANCGKSECKKYAERFCAKAQEVPGSTPGTKPSSASTDESEECKQAKEKIKNWSSDTCRIEGNKLDIDKQAKDNENELK